MKKTLMLPALIFAVAGSVAGCANCNSCCGDDCAEVVEVEAVEVIPCNDCKTKHKCKTMHKHDKNCKDLKKCSKTTACNHSGKEQDEQGTSRTQGQTADCGSCSKDENKATGSTEKTVSAIF